MKNTKYGFYGKLKSEFPLQINVDLTEKCNLSCIHCQHSLFVESLDYHGTDMEEKINTKMVQEVRKDGKNITEYIRYTANGEPLLHPKGYQFIQEAVQDSGVPVTLTTNGTRIDHKKMESLMIEGLFLLDISIDANSPETYQQIRVGGDFKKVNENIKKMIHYRNDNKSKTRIVVSFIEQPLNMHETKQFKTYWESQGIDFVIIRKLHSNGGEFKSLAENLQKSTYNIPRKPCIYPWERICLKPDGTLHYCPSSWTHEKFISDFHTSSIKETWLSDKYNDLRNSHLNSDFLNFPMCEQCPDWINILWESEGRNYSNIVEDFLVKKEDL